jgi:protein-S-isoprenylcysteine O-methyltransferase Ste14
MILWTVFAFGWIFLFLSTRLINDRHLFGIQQVYENLKGKKLSDPEFQIPAFYRFTRHPMMLGFIIVFWATPQMSLGHLLFASLNTIYIFIGIQFEERELHHIFGKKYKKYSEQVSMLIPFKIFNSAQEKHLVYEEDK